MIRYAILVLTFSIVFSCQSEPVAIEYGSDECAACKMIISDAKFGAELVTQKGKVYKYDAIECMLPVIRNNGEEHYSYILTTDYNTPAKLIDGRACFYLISKNRPSPMGAFLSAYPNQESSIKAQQSHGGEILNWEELLVSE